MLPSFGVINVINATNTERKAFNEMCKSAPPKVAEQMRAERKSKQEAETAHRKALEIAEAGRTRNFWGN